MSNGTSGQRQLLRRLAHRAMIDRGLEPDFSPAALAEVERIDSRGSASPGTARDLRGLPWASIDNDDSLDLDQLSVATRMPGGAFKVLVAIADVGGVVGKGTAIDDHARANTTSVYTAAEIFPMLPERLSTDLTSLADARDRGAVVVEMTVADEGSVTAADHYPALVHNHAKLAYRRVAAWLDGDAEAPAGVAAVSGLADSLRLQDEVAKKLRQLRYQNGALDLQTIEARPVFDADTIAEPRPRGAQQRQGDHRGPHDRGQRRHRALPRLARRTLAAADRAGAEALGSDRRGRGPAQRVTACRAGRPVRWRTSSADVRRRTRCASPTSRSPSSSCSAPGSTPSSRPATSRPATSGSPCAATPTPPRPTAATPIS